MNSEVAELSCVFCLNKPDQAVGNIVYFHPGGLSSESLRDSLENYSSWNVYVVEMMLNKKYMEVENVNGKLNTSIEAIGQEIVDGLRLEALNTIFIGWSFGGVMAYEVSSKISSDIQPEIVLLDSIAPSSDFFKNKSKIKQNRLIFEWFHQYMESLKGRKLHRPNVRKDDEVYSGLNTLLRECISLGLFPQRTKIAGFEKIYKTFKSGLLKNSGLGSSYIPIRQSNPITLVRAKKGLLLRFKWCRDMGWKKYAPNLKIVTLPYNHYQLISDKKAQSDVDSIIRKIVSA